jgi:hypothetical protein
MTDENTACCWILFAGRTVADVVTLLNARPAGAARSQLDATDPSAPWPSVGPAGGGSTLIIDPHFEFGDMDSQLRQYSLGTRILRLLVIEHEKFSHATEWADGEIMWEVSFEGELDERPVISDRFPFDLDELASTMGTRRDPEVWYQVAVVAVQRRTGWRPRLARGDADELWGTELVYPRPSGVATAVARDLGGSATDVGGVGGSLANSP